MTYFNKLDKMKIIIIFTFLITLAIQAEAQDRSGILEANENSVGFATGLDYSIMPIQLSYKRGFDIGNYKFPFTAGADVTIPLFSFDLNDIRIRLITEMTFLRKKNFELRGGIDPVFVNLKMETETMSSLGADFHVFAGFTNAKWNTGMEFTYNKIFSTHITHTDVYKDNVYEGAVDGWYKTTAANIRIGVLANYRIKKFDINLRAGISRTGQFNDYLFVPSMYANLGVSYRF